MLQRFHRVCNHLRHEVPEAVIPPGIQAAYAEQGELLYELAVGTDASSVPLLPATPFHIASLSKPITALLTLRMADIGIVDQDAPVWPALTTWEPTPDQTQGFNHRTTTLRHLLGHTSGWNLPRLPSWPFQDEPNAPTVVDLLRGSPLLEQPARMLADPGTYTEYSAIGYAIIQLVLEHASGETFEALLNRHIARPLGLSTLSAARSRLCADDDRFFITRAASGMTATPGELARLFSLAAACSKGKSNFLAHDLARAMFNNPGPGVEGQTFGLGFALASWPPDTIFKHSGYSFRCCTVTEGFRDDTCAVSIRATAPHPGGRMLAQRVSGAIFEAVREARDAEIASQR